MPAFEDNPNGLREALEAAVTQAEAPAPTPSPSPTPSPDASGTAADTSGGGTAASAPPPGYPGSAPAPVDTSAAPTPVSQTAQPGSTPVQGAGGTQPPQSAPTEPVPLPDGTNPYAKPPGTWTPAARESWNALPSEVKQEVWKREREASRALTMSTEARRFQDEFSRTMQPYLGFIAAENSTPLQAVNYMMQTAAALRVGSAEQKVSLVAGIIKQYGIDLQALDSVLAGQKPQYDPQHVVQQAVQQQIAPLMRMFQSQRQQEEFALQSRVDNDLNSFVNQANPDGSPKHEFFADVQDVMADLIDVASRRGQSLGLTEAYERAIMLHEPVRRVIEARKQRQSATQMTFAANQAKGTAASVTPSTEVETAKPMVGDSIRASIEAAIAAQQGR